MKRTGLALGAASALLLPLTPLGVLALIAGLALCAVALGMFAGAAYVACHLDFGRAVA
jgi:hypothetical protein